MLRYLTILLVFCTLSACVESDNEEFTSVQIEEVFRDSLSIRAIAPMSADRVWFGANQGMVGLIDSLTPKLARVKYEEDFREFRSIAIGKDAVYILSVESPAVLYRIGFDGEEATAVELVYTEEGEGVFYDAMTFWDEKEGIAMGDPVGNCLSIIITRDGGRNWSKVDCSQLPSTVSGEAAFAASNSNIAVSGDHAWIVTGGKKARVFHTPDRGSNWEVFETPIVSGGAMTGIYSVDFWDDQNGIIFGGDWENKARNKGNKAVTTDGGKNWKLIADGNDPGYRSSVRFVPGSSGRGVVAVGSPGISYSPDGGESWTALSNEGFYAIEFVNDTLAYASGRNRIAKLIFR